MTESILFTTYLNDLLTDRRISKDHLIHEMGYVTPVPVTRWLEGRGRPALEELSQLATVLRADPVEIVCGWVIDQCPELEEVLRVQVLDLRASTFPRSTNLALRAPRPRKRVPPW